MNFYKIKTMKMQKPGQNSTTTQRFTRRIKKGLNNLRKLRLENLKNDLIIRELEQNGDREKLGEFYEKLAQKAKAEEERRLDKQVSELPEATRRKLLSEVKKATEKALKA